MRRKFFIALLFSMSLAAGQAMAQDFQSKYSQEMTDQGFSNLTVTKTWLGRTRITAVSKTQSRELVFDTYTGEVLRDYSEKLDPSQLAPSNTDLKDPTELQGGSEDNGNGNGASESGGSESGNGGGDSESGGNNGGDNGGDNGGGNGGDNGGGDSGGGSGGGDGGHAALELGPSPLDYLTGGGAANVNLHMTV